MNRQQSLSFNIKAPDYSTITESPGLKASQEQVARVYHRYQFARNFCQDGNVLEVGCGAGLGLGYLARVAKRVVGGDIEEKNVNLAKNYYSGRQNIVFGLIDAHNISFDDRSFDVALLYETIYYLKDPKRCIKEIARILKDSGVLIICTVNKGWEDFHPSPYSYKYFSPPELYGLMKERFREVKLYGGFSTQNGGAAGEIISLIKRSAVKFKLIPGSLKARAYLKRIFMGRLVPLPPEITENMVPYQPPIEIRPDKFCRDFKIIYAVGKK